MSTLLWNCCSWNTIAFPDLLVGCWAGSYCLVRADLLDFGEFYKAIGLPWWCSGKETACQCRRCGFGFLRKWQPILVFLPGKSHGQRSLAGYSQWGHKEWDTTWAQHREHFLDHFFKCENLDFIQTTHFNHKISNPHVLSTSYVPRSVLSTLRKLSHSILPIILKADIVITYILPKYRQSNLLKVT